MKTEFVAGRLDVGAFARAGASLQGREPLAAFARLAAESEETQESRGREVAWSATGAMRQAEGRPEQAWLHLQASASLAQTCQRCLAPMDTVLEVDRSFRFVADEATAAAEDDEAEEDVLVLARDFDLRGLVEDELLMDLPVAPRHEVCPASLPMAAADPEAHAEEGRPNPFAALAQLKKSQSG